MKKNTLTKLVALATVLLVSVGTIAGSTVAWFTDTEYAVNTIQSGELDIEWQYAAYDKDAEDFGAEQNIEPGTPILGVDALYEPGYTEVIKLKVKNDGDLALKYKLNVVIVEETPGIGREPDPVDKDTELYLSEYLKVAAVPVEELPLDRAGIWDMMSDEADPYIPYLYDGVNAYDKITVNYVDNEGTTQSVTNVPYMPVIDGQLLPADDSTDSETEENAVATASETSEDSGIEDGDSTSADGETTEDSTEDPVEQPSGEGEAEAEPEGSTDDGSSDEIALILCMPTSVGNEANHTADSPKPTIKLGLYLEAAQLTYESDSYDSEYDAEATYADGTTGMESANSGGQSGVDAPELGNMIPVYQLGAFEIGWEESVTGIDENGAETKETGWSLLSRTGVGKDQEGNDVTIESVQEDQHLDINDTEYFAYWDTAESAYTTKTLYEADETGSIIKRSGYIQKLGGGKILESAGTSYPYYQTMNLPGQNIMIAANAFEPGLQVRVEKDTTLYGSATTAFKTDLIDNEWTTESDPIVSFYLPGVTDVNALQETDFYKSLVTVVGEDNKSKLLDGRIAFYSCTADAKFDEENTSINGTKLTLTSDSDVAETN